MSAPEPSARRALLVIDAQNEYAEGGALALAWPDPTLSRGSIAAVMDAARAAGVTIVVVRQDNPAGAWACAAGTAGAELLPEVAARPADHVVAKRLPSAFAGTGLDAWLRERGIGRLTLVGYMTQNCVESTAREAAHLGYAVGVLSDATGTVGLRTAAGTRSAREVHESSLVVMASWYAAVADSPTWLADLAAGREWVKPVLADAVCPASVPVG